MKKMKIEKANCGASVKAYNGGFPCLKVLSLAVAEPEDTFSRR